jgi:hypothetical protein
MKIRSFSKKSPEAPPPNVLNEHTEDFHYAIAQLKEQVFYSHELMGFYPVGLQEVTPEEEIHYEEVESIFMNELMNTNLHYDIIGENEFQRLLGLGIKALDGEAMVEENEFTAVTEDFVPTEEVVVEETVIEGEQMKKMQKQANLEEEVEYVSEGVEEEVANSEEVEYEEEEEEEEEEETPLTLLFDFMMEIHQEAKANPEADEEYLKKRLQMGLTTRGIEPQYL